MPLDRSSALRVQDLLLPLFPDRGPYIGTLQRRRGGGFVARGPSGPSGSGGGDGGEEDAGMEDGSPGGGPGSIPGSPGGGGVVAGLNFNRFVVSFAVQADNQDMGNLVQGPFTGPLFLRRSWFFFGDNSSTTTILFNTLRVEFSDNETLQAPTFQAAALPTGFVPDGIPLFTGGAFRDVAGGSIVDMDRFFLRSPSPAGPEHVMDFEARLWIPYDKFWIKTYYGNDTTADSWVFGVHNFVQPQWAVGLGSGQSVLPPAMPTL